MENAFVLWTAEKKVKDSDLQFVHLLKTPAQEQIFQQISNRVAALKPSFTEGLFVLETITELILMGHHDDLFSHLDTLITYKNYIHGLRYPVTTSSDDLLKNKFQNLPWPPASKVKFERRGDRAGVEFKFFISSKTDIIKIIAAFERVQSEMQ